MGDVPEMVERVARAMCRAAGIDPDFRGEILSATGGKAKWEYEVPSARAAIEAMREPGEAVIAAVENKAEERYNAAPAMLRWYGEDVWAAGIDAALASQGNGRER